MHTAGQTVAGWWGYAEVHPILATSLLGVVLTAAVSYGTVRLIRLRSRRARAAATERDLGHEQHRLGNRRQSHRIRGGL